MRPDTTGASLARSRPSGPGRLRALPDDRLGELVMAVVVSEMRWVPDVAPAVIDRLARDAVAYPEHLGRTPEPAVVAAGPEGRATGRRPGGKALLVVSAGAAVLAAAVLLLGSQAVQGSAGDPAAVGLMAPLAQGFEQPLLVTGAGTGSGRSHVVEQTGRTRIIEPDGSVARELGMDAAGAPIAVDQGGRILRVVARPAEAARPTADGAPRADDRASRAAEGAPHAVGGAPRARRFLTAAGESPGAPVEADDASPEPAFDPDAVHIRLVPVVAGLVSPVSVANDGTDEGLLYVVERAGLIRVLAPDGIRSDALLDISELVGTGGELGLHDVAFHPRFARNGRFYVHYNDLRSDSRIDEFRVRRGRLPADPDTRRRILEVEQPFINNNGGWLDFGPDGYLYIALGDGGGPSPGDPSGYGQRRDTLLAKILRVDVDRGRAYAVPPDNPFTSRRQRRIFAPETWVWGLRDPRRASFDRATGDLWIGDVGQDRYEEIDRVPAGRSGLNFGWSDMEGDRCHLVADCEPADYTAPVHVYDRAPPQCGVVGGHVYRGEAIPTLQGAYLFSDVCSGVIWALDAEAVRRGEDPAAVALLDAPQGFWAFGEDDAGEIYLASLDGGIYRIEAEDTG